MRYIQIFVTAAALLALAATGGAQERGGRGGRGGGIQLPPMIHITIADFADGDRIPNKYTCAGSPMAPSPAMSWTGAPANTQSYVVILHDPDPVLQGSATNDVLHWAIIDIPGDAKGLPEGVKAGEQSDGAKNVNNITGQPVYMGPCAPPGHGDHHYTFEVYALNAKLGLPSSTSRADLMNAMNGKVIAKGVYIGIFGQK
jgi:Raf kinase inhibitor-like YbhB/YbcL family protein